VRACLAAALIARIATAISAKRRQIQGKALLLFRANIDRSKPLPAQFAGDIVSADFQKTLADHGIDFGFDANLDSFTGSERFLADDKDLASTLLGDTPTLPTSPSPKFT